MLLSEFYPLVAALTDPQQRRWSAGAAYLLSEAMRNGESAAAAEARILTVPQYANGLAAAGLTANFNSIIAPSAPFVSDTFVGPDGQLLTAHTGEVGATWTKAFGMNDDLTINTNRVIGIGAANFARHQASGSPPSADYTVTSTVDVLTLLAGSFVEVGTRQATGADTAYRVVLSADNTLQLIRQLAGAALQLTGSPLTLAGGDVLVAATTRTLGIQVTGTTITALLDGVAKLTVTNADVAAAGKAAIRARNSTATAGLTISSITAY